MTCACNADENKYINLNMTECVEDTQCGESTQLVAAPEGNNFVAGSCKCSSEYYVDSDGTKCVVRSKCTQIGETRYYTDNATMSCVVARDCSNDDVGSEIPYMYDSAIGGECVPLISRCN